MRNHFNCSGGWTEGKHMMMRLDDGGDDDDDDNNNDTGQEHCWSL